MAAIFRIGLWCASNNSPQQVSTWPFSSGLMKYSEYYSHSQMIFSLFISTWKKKTKLIPFSVYLLILSLDKAHKTQSQPLKEHAIVYICLSILFYEHSHWVLIPHVLENSLSYTNSIITQVLDTFPIPLSPNNHKLNHNTDEYGLPKKMSPTN